MSDFTKPDPRTEADVDARIVMPYLAALGVQSDQLRAQHTFSLRLGRNMIHNVGGGSVRTGRLDYLIIRADGRPLFVVELKGPNEALTEDDRDQGISYARLLDTMAPLVLVTNGTDRRLYDTVTREELNDPSSASLVVGGGQLTDDESLRVRAEALEHFIGYSAENVAVFSRAQRATRMETLRGSALQHTRKYEVDLYLRRETVRRAVEQFLDASQTVFALVGPSGFGKTNEMCALAEELGETHLTLFFNGADLPRPLTQVLADEFDWHFSEALPLQKIMRRIAKFAARSGCPVLIVIDAVDEVGSPAFCQELADLASQLDVFRGQIRLIVSAKPQEWRRFTEVRGNPSALHSRVYVASNRNSQQGSPAEEEVSPDLRISAAVNPFTDSERDRAIEVYSAAFGLSGTWSYDVRELARDPFMLRMIAEVGATNGEVPQNSGERELLRRYVEQKIRRTADPERSRLELITVAKTLAASDANSVTPPPESRKSIVPNHSNTSTERLSVLESDVRVVANLPATTPIADDLVGFGVLLRMWNQDGEARLAFAYDRVRDYMVATHALKLPELAGDSFVDVAQTSFDSDLASSALLWFLRYATDEQWAGFVKAAERQVERLIDTYDQIRQHIALPARAAIAPRTLGSIGVAFSGTRSGVFALGFFRRELEILPRVCFDPAVGDFNTPPAAEMFVPIRLMGDRRKGSGFWFLRHPERYAATHIKRELEQLVLKGMLVEADHALEDERVVALMIAHASKLKFRPHQRRTVLRFADHFIGRELFPLDLREVRRVVQTELAIRSYQDEHLRKRYDEEVQKHLAGGEVLSIISGNWTNADVQAWRERASREVEEGQEFAENSRTEDELTLLATSVNAVLERREIVDEPLLPPPDVADDDVLSGTRVFEDGYSDGQLAQLIETIFDRGLRAYDRVMIDTFSSELLSLLVDPPSHIGVVCYRHAVGEGYSSQFRATVGIGPALPLHGAPPEGKRAVAVTVPLERDCGTRLDDTELVTTSAGQFEIRVHRSTGLVSIINPFDAPPFRSHSSNSSARFAPVRAVVYEEAKRAIKRLTVENLQSLCGSQGE